MILSSIGFDFRVVGGTLDAEPALDAAVAEARTNPAFLRLLARVALRDEPPTGFVRKLVVQAKGEHAGTLDIKHGGITIVTSIARARAVAGGSPAKDTLTRLRDAVAGGTLRAESGAELTEAFRFLMELRLRHQVAQVRAACRPTTSSTRPTRHDRARGLTGSLPGDPRRAADPGAGDGYRT